MDALLEGSTAVPMFLTRAHVLHSRRFTLFAVWCVFSCNRPESSANPESRSSDRPSVIDASSSNSQGAGRRASGAVRSEEADSRSGEDTPSAEEPPAGSEMPSALERPSDDPLDAGASGLSTDLGLAKPQAERDASAPASLPTAKLDASVTSATSPLIKVNPDAASLTPDAALPEPDAGGGLLLDGSSPCVAAEGAEQGSESCSSTVTPRPEQLEACQLELEECLEAAETRYQDCKAPLDAACDACRARCTTESCQDACTALECNATCCSCEDAISEDRAACNNAYADCVLLAGSQ